MNIISLAIWLGILHIFFNLVGWLYKKTKYYRHVIVPKINYFFLMDVELILSVIKNYKVNSTTQKVEFFYDLTNHQFTVSDMIKRLENPKKPTLFFNIYDINSDYWKLLDHTIYTIKELFAAENFDDFSEGMLKIHKLHDFAYKAIGHTKNYDVVIPIYTLFGIDFSFCPHNYPPPFALRDTRFLKI